MCTLHRIHRYTDCEFPTQHTTETNINISEKYWDPYTALRLHRLRDGSFAYSAPLSLAFLAKRLRTQLGLDKAVLAHARNEAQQEAEDGDVSIGDSRGMISTRGTGKVREDPCWIYGRRRSAPAQKNIWKT